MEPQIRIAVHDFKSGSVRGYIVVSKAVKKLRKIKMEPGVFDTLHASILDSSPKKIANIMHLEGDEFVTELKKVIKHFRQSN